MEHQLAFADASGGQNAADPAHKILPTQYARGVNVAIVEQYPTTRPRCRVVPLEGQPKEAFESLNIQGATFFNPSKGQGGIILAQDQSMLPVAAGGRKFVVTIRGRHSNSVADIAEITNQRFTNPSLHLVWWAPCEDILLCQDGHARAFIWRRGQPAFFSTGYDSIRKSRSTVPNGATVTAYAHGRIVTVVNRRLILVGDSLHRTDQSSSSNMLDYIEQVYWASGQYFLPPSKMGNINGAEILPIQNTQHGHGDLLFHCEDGIFSVNLNVFPRERWPEVEMVKHAVLGTGAAGPYALCVYRGGQVFRSRKGIETLQSAASEESIEGSPDQPLSEGVDCWLKNDYDRWLRFASVHIWEKARRTFCTTYPIVQGSFRWHRGFVSRNNLPNPTNRNSPAVWEGLWTFPPAFRDVVQFVGGMFDWRERVFAWARGKDGKNRLVEFTEQVGADRLEDASEIPIRCQLVTRSIDVGQWWKKRNFVETFLYLRNVRGKLKWAVHYKLEESPKWIPLRCGTVEVPEMMPDCGDLRQPTARTTPVPLGSIPSSCVADIKKSGNETRGIQFLIRWEGYTQIEGIRVEHGDSNLNESFKCDQAKLTFTAAPDVEYDDFEYSQNEQPLWYERTQ